MKSFCLSSTLKLVEVGGHDGAGRYPSTGRMAPSLRAAKETMSLKGGQEGGLIGVQCSMETSFQFWLNN